MGKFLDETGLSTVWGLVVDEIGEAEARCAKVESGSYEGTGESSAMGASYTNTLTFGLTPKLVMIFNPTAATIGYFCEGASTYIVGSQGGSFFVVDAFGQTMTWHYGGNTSGGGMQMNASGETYYYVAIG